MLEDKKPEGECTPTSEWGDLNQLTELAEKVRGDRTELRDALRELDKKLTPSFKGAGVKVAYLAWRIQKYRGWWGIWYVPEDSANDSGNPEDGFGFYPLTTIDDAPHTELMAFAEGEGAKLMKRYLAALQEKAPQIKDDVERIQRVLAAFQTA